MVEKEEVVKEDDGLKVVQVATETAEQIVDGEEVLSERQLLVNIYNKLLALEDSLK